MTWPSPLGDALSARIRGTKLIAFDFDGVFTDNAVWVLENGVEAVRCTRMDGLGLRKLERLGVRAMIISSEENPLVTFRSRKLRIECIHNCPDKLATLNGIIADLGITLGDVAFVGNDVNDLSCLKAVGLPIVVADAHPEVLGTGLLRTSARGGYGAVREICDLFERVRDGVPTA